MFNVFITGFTECLLLNIKHFIAFNLLRKLFGENNKQ